MALVFSHPWPRCCATPTTEPFKALGYWCTKNGSSTSTTSHSKVKCSGNSNLLQTTIQRATLRLAWTTFMQLNRRKLSLCLFYSLTQCINWLSRTLCLSNLILSFYLTWLRRCLLAATLSSSGMEGLWQHKMSCLTSLKPWVYSTIFLLRLYALNFKTRVIHQLAMLLSWKEWDLSTWKCAPKAFATGKSTSVGSSLSMWRLKDCPNKMQRVRICST